MPASAIARLIAVWLCIGLGLVVVTACAPLTVGWGPLTAWCGKLLIITGLGVAALNGVARMNVEDNDVPNTRVGCRR